MEPARQMNNLRSFQAGAAAQNNTASLSQHKQLKRMRLGQLLIESQLVSGEHLHEALTISAHTGQKMGKVLSSLQYISEKDMQSALLAQSLVGEGILDERTAIAALKKAVEAGLSLAEVLDESAPEKAAVERVLELEQLVIRANLVSQQAFELALDKSRSEGVPFGRALILTNGIAFSLLSSALEAVSQVRNGALDATDAVKALKEVKKNQYTLDDALHGLKISPKSSINRIKLGDLLTSGKGSSERDNLGAGERALSERRMLGEILVASGLVPSGVLNDTLALQDMVLKGVISIDSAAKAVRMMRDERISLQQAAAVLKLFADEAHADDAIALLIKANLVNSDLYSRAVRMQMQHRMGPLKALVASQLLSPITHKAAISARKMVADGDLSEAEAVVCLQTVDRKRCTLIEALSEIRGESRRKAPVQEHSDEMKVLFEQKKAECKAERRSMSMRVIVAIMAVVGVLCLIVQLTVPQDWHIPAMAMVGLVGSIGVFVVGKAGTREDELAEQAVLKEAENARGMINRFRTKR
ncbi:MAG TPA: hypothetical protein EYM95_15445 [Candidatus Obscuribacterales bacterium]|nr:hypothetical protein [Candidatus Obscuribacterales bacterium]